MKDPSNYFNVTISNEFFKGLECRVSGIVGQTYGKFPLQKNEINIVMEYNYFIESSKSYFDVNDTPPAFLAYLS